MDLHNAINKGYTIKFKPPNLKFVIGELKAVQEMMGLDSGIPYTTEENDIELSVQAVEGIYGLLGNIGDKITKIAEEEVGQQIDDAPEPETGTRICEYCKKKLNEDELLLCAACSATIQAQDEKAPEPAPTGTDSEASE